MSLERIVIRPTALAVLVPFAACMAQPREPGSHAQPDPGPEVSFRREIRPILAEYCIGCHGPEASTRQAGLRLDVREGWLEDPQGRPVVVPGDPGASLLYLRMMAPGASRMPPPAAGPGPNAEQIAKVARWIRQGARWDAHWSMETPRRAALPAVRDTNWPRNPIDRFVLARLEAEGLSPSPVAPPERLLRRLSLDLGGLPPTLAELDEFVGRGASDAAYAEAVEARLASPRYGEHRARDWLDAARYADSNGYHGDQDRDVWPWRDWVVHAFNRNLAFDQFTIEQLTGDLLPGATPDQQLAAAFNRNHGVTTEGGTIDEEFRLIYAADRVDTLGTVWLGLTLGCARCHDHKYDPISHRDYYQLLACFNRVGDRGDGGNALHPNLAARGPVVEARRTELSAEAERLDATHRAAWDEAHFAAWRTAPERLREPRWTTLPYVAGTTSHGSTISSRADGALVVSGSPSAYEGFDLAFGPLPVDTRALRLEARSDPSLPAGGPGRAHDGGFSLSELDVFVETPEEREVVRFVIAATEAGGDAWAALDGRGSTGWSPESSGEASLWLVPQAPLPAGGLLRVRLEHFQGGSRVLGAFQISGSEDLSATQPPPISAALAAPPSSWSAEQNDAVRRHYALTAAPAALRAAAVARAELERTRAALEPTPRVPVVRDEEPGRVTHILERGDYQSPGAVVTCGAPAAFGQVALSSRDRLGLARWLVSRDNPLVARVVVNRLWRAFFLRGLVETVDDLGVRGEYPSHPELLDWLAVEFMDSGWDLKHIVRLIVSSATYRQDSTARPSEEAQDPQNRRLARGPRGLLAAEVLRDQALFLSGLLVERLGGPSVRPYHPHGLWEALNDGNGAVTWYRPDRKDELWRRSLYTYWKRSLPPPALALLGAPSRETSAVSREASLTPMQALVLLNEPVFLEAARKLAERMLEAGTGPESWVTYGHRLATARWPEPQELQLLVDLYHAELESLGGRPELAAARLSQGDSARSSGASVLEHAALSSVARVLLNLAETITKE